MHEHMENPEEFLPTPEEESAEGQQAALGIFRYIQGVGYPAAKEDIIDFATDQGASETVLEVFEQLPDTTYDTPDEVSQALGENA